MSIWIALVVAPVIGLACVMWRVRRDNAGLAASRAANVYRRPIETRSMESF